MKPENDIERQLDALGDRLRSRPPLTDRVMQTLAQIPAEQVEPLVPPKPMSITIRFRRRWLLGFALAASVLIYITCLAPSSTAGWNDVVKAVAHQDWIVATTTYPDGGRATIWMSGPRKIWACRTQLGVIFVDGQYRSRDEYRHGDSQILSVSASEQDARRASIVDDDAENWQILSPWLSDDERIVSQKRRTLNEGGKSWIEFDLVLAPGENRQGLLRVDPQTRLPAFLQFTSPADPAQTTRFDFSYPSKGPTNIYELGVSVETAIPDQIPSTVQVTEPADIQLNSEPDAHEKNDESASRLAWMKKTAARIKIHVANKPAVQLNLETRPVMRWDNQRSYVIDAAAFVWLADHRPQAIGGTWIKNGEARFELHSLSSKPLSVGVDGQERWSTNRPGIVWNELPDVPAPDRSRPISLRQMKQLAREFSVYAVKTPPDYEDGSIWHFRMLSQPIYRYSEQAAVDGAIFAFTQGTDPEAYLILESHESDDKSVWRFAFVRACIWEMHAKRNDTEVWQVVKWDPHSPERVYGLVGPFAVDR